MNPEPEIADPDQADKPPTEATAADEPPPNEATAGADMPRTPRATAGPTPNRPTYKVERPQMGAVLQTDVDKFVAVVGGKPKPDWSGLEEPITSSVVEATRHRPTATSPNTQGREHRRKGQEPAFKMGDNLTDFVEHVEIHLEETGMDTIAYVQDPADPNRVYSCVADYPRFNTRVMQRMLVGRFDKYDQYDKANDKERYRISS